MPYKRKKNRKTKNGDTQVKKVLVLKEEMEEYAKIMKSLGNRRMNVILPDSLEYIAVIPGRFRKRCWMKEGDIVLVSFREFEEKKVDIVYKYDDNQRRELYRNKEIPSFFMDVTSTKDNNEIEIGYDIQDVDNYLTKKEEFDFNAI